METSVLATHFAILALKKWVKTARGGQFLNDDFLNNLENLISPWAREKKNILSLIHKVTFP